MKRIVLLFFALALMSSSFGQLSGIKTIPGDYASIAAAITALNAQGVGSGGVIFNVAAGYTETLTGRLDLTATGTFSNQIIFQKSGFGADPLITAYSGTSLPGSATPDGMWSLTGCDYVTIDGIDLQEAAGNNTPTLQMEYGYGLFKASGTDGASNNRISSCTITLNRNNNGTGGGPFYYGSTGIVLMDCTPTTGNTIMTVTAATGASSSNKFFFNTLQNMNCGIALSGYPDVSPFTLADANNDIGGATSGTGNIILNFGGGTAAANPSAGIYLKDQWGFNIGYNTLNNNDGAGVNHPTIMRGIYTTASTGASGSINHNTLTLKGGGTTSQISVIENTAGSTAGGNTITISNNTITNCTNTLNTTGAWYGIWNNAASCTNLNIQNNQFTGNANNATSGAMYLIYNNGACPGTVNITGNSLSQSLPGAVAYTGTMYNIYNSSGTTATTLNINSNNFSSYTHTTIGTGSIYFIYNTNSNANLSISNNTWTNLTMNHSGSEYLMYNSSNTQVALNVNNNSIVTGFTRTAAAGTMYIYYAGSSSLPTSTQTFSGNNFSNITATTSGSGTFYCFYNSDGATSPYPKKTVTNNTLSNITYNTTGSAYGFYTSYLGDGGTGSGSTINNNTISGFTTSGTIYSLYPGSTVSPSYQPSCYGNVVNNVTTNGASSTAYGMYLAGGGAGLNIYKNKVYSIQANGATGVAYGMYVTSAVTTNIFNNLVGDIKAPTSSLTAPAPSVAGLYISGGTTVNVYYNTIYLNATGSGTNFGSAAIYASTTPTVTLRNNIFVNASTPAGTGKAMAFQRSSTTLTTYGANSNNNLFYAGTPGANNLILFDATNSYQTLADFKTLVAPRDAASITENPPFLSTTGSNPSFLHINTAVATQIESGGANISGITDDFDGDIRQGNAGYGGTGSAPDIGGDEFNGILLDLNPPTITLTPLGNTASTGARVLTSNITDGTGVPTSGIGLPRLYWRINSGTWNNVTGVWVSGSQYTFTFGAGVVLNDVVSYYIVAQDAATPTPNVGANPSAGAGGFTYNPPAAGTPPTTPYSYTIVPTLCGTKTVGTGGDYANLTAAAAAINLSEFSCPVTLLLLSTYSSTGETFPIVFNPNPGSSPTNTLTIKPNTGVTASVTGASASGPILRILNSNTIIDGSNTAGGTTRDLTISNTSTTTPQVIVIGSTGTTPITNVVLKNTIDINGVNSSSAVIISDGATAGSAGWFNNITVQNNSLQLAYIALYCNATVAAGNGSGLLITGNNINTSGANSVRLVGVYVQGVDGATVTNNNIGNFANTADASNLTGVWFATGTVNSTISGNTISTLSGTSTGPRGIAVSSGATGSNVAITGNTITTLTTSSSQIPYGIYVFSTTTGVSVRNNQVGGLLNSNTSGYGARGIYLATGMAASNISLINNLVYDIKCTSDAGQTYWNIGIGVDGSTGGVNVYHNSVYLSGTYAGYTSATISAAFYAGTGNTALDIRDNIFANTYDNTGSSTDKSYAIYSGVANTAFTNIDYNNYFVSGTPGVLGYLGADQTTLAAWRIATGQDLFSTNFDPLFVSSTDLHPTNVAMNNLGFYLPAVPADYSGALRTNPPDMGAYEFGGDPVVNTLAATGITNISATGNGTINAAGLSVNSFFDWGLTTAYGNSVAGSPATVTGTTTTPISGPLTGLAPLTTYHFRARGVAGGLTIYGPDLTFTTAPDPPTVVTTNATAITTTGATLNGTVNANGGSATVSFEYGLTIAYGSTITAIPPTVTGNTVTPVNAPITGLQPNMLYHFRVKATNAGGTSNGNDMTFTTNAAPPIVVTDPASGIGTSFATLNGTVTAQNSSTTVTFDWGLTPAFGNTAPGVPSPVTGNTATAVSANISGLTPNTTYYFRCVGVNGAGPTYGATLSFLAGCPPVGPAGTITGPVSVCANSAGNVYSIAAIPNATGYVWTVPAGASVTAGSNTTSITVTFGTTSGNVSVYGTSACGNGAPSNLAVTVNPLPSPTITGPSSACAGSTGNVYTTQSGMTNYVWTVSAGGTITGGTGTNALTVTWNTSGAQTVSVNYTNASGCTATTPTSYAVNVLPAPTPTITGPTSLCVNSGFYNYTTQTGMTNYVWTISAGGSITSGQGTSQVQVTWNQAGAQWVAVNYNGANGCPAGAPTQYPVTVNPAPGAAGSITGSPSVCGGTMGVSYSVAPIPDAIAYVWTLPAGATIASGSGTNAITVDFAANASSGDITVYGNNLCGNGAPSPPYAVLVTALPADAGTITGQSSVCQGTSGVIYSVGAIANATDYTWSVPPGATIVAGNNSNTITVDFSLIAVSGDITVFGSNSCGSGAPSPAFPVTVNPIPEAPVITLLDQTLSSNVPTGNQWYFNGGPIPGATGQTYVVDLTGTYWDVVTVNGCASDTSNNLYVVVTGTGEHGLTSRFSVHPNPSNGLFTIDLDGAKPGNYTLEVRNILGALVWSSTNLNITGSFRQTIDIRPVAMGVYTVILRNNNSHEVRKLLINY